MRQAAAQSANSQPIANKSDAVVLPENSDEGGDPNDAQPVSLRLSGDPYDDLEDDDDY
jgi:hypothetical protein